MIKKMIKKKIKKRAPKTTRRRVARKRIHKRKKQVSAIALIRHENNPVISPKSENGWEAWQTFNPGVVLLNERVHFLYRAIGEDGLSRFGYAASNDGFYIDERLSYPVYEHKIGQRPYFNVSSYFSGGSFGGAEDPRLVRVEEEDTLYMTYTACDGGLRVALTSIKVKDFLEKRWKWKSFKLISPPNEVHKNWVIFPEKINGKYAILTSITPEILIEYLDSLEFEDGRYIESNYGNISRKNCWDTYVRGVGPPPLKTKHGWLLFYHALDWRDPGKYKVGAMLLDLDNPTKILHRSKEPVLEPDAYYENNGFKAGVVYASGAVVKYGLLLLYYGGADSYVCVAHAPFDEFVDALAKGVKPKLKFKPVKRK